MVVYSGGRVVGYIPCGRKTIGRSEVVVGSLFFFSQPRDVGQVCGYRRGWYSGEDGSFRRDRW